MHQRLTTFARLVLIAALLVSIGAHVLWLVNYLQQRHSAHPADTLIEQPYSEAKL
jgi:hypothetical protein